MPVNSKKQSQGQRGKKGDDAKTKTIKTSTKENIFDSNKKETVVKGKGFR